MEMVRRLWTALGRLDVMAWLAIWWCFALVQDAFRWVRAEWARFTMEDAGPWAEMLMAQGAEIAFARMMVTLAFLWIVFHMMAHDE